MKKKSCTNSSLPALILTFALLIFWQAAAMGVNAAYILPSPTQILQKIWELRVPLFMAHLPATMSVVAIGLLISVVLGIGLAILMDVSEVAEKALYPLIIADDSDYSTGAIVRALVRVFHLEQSTGNRIDYIFSDYDHCV